MQRHLFTLSLLFSLFVGSANNAWACGHCGMEKSGRTASQKSCCGDRGDKNAGHCTAKADACGEHHPGQKCPDGKGSGGCHCPCGTASGAHAGGLLAEPSPSLLPHASSSEATMRQAYYFAQHMPEAVYLPIWQPPKLGV